jgi:hypothetical protein
MADGDETQAMSDGGDDRTQAMSGGGDSTRVAQPTSGGDDNGGNRKPLWILLGVLLFGVVVGGGIAIAGGGDDKEEGASTSTSSSSTSTSTSTTTATTTPTSQGGGGGGGGGNTNDDPRIDSFSASPGTITCATETDSKSVNLSWATSNTTEVVLSVDGPGAYGTYGPSGSQSVGIACPTQGTSAQHTYTITAKGPNGPDASQTITYSINTIPI